MMTTFLQRTAVALGLTWGFSFGALAQTAPTCSVEGYGEMNVTTNGKGWQTALPHVVVNVERRWTRGWSIVGELEMTDALEVAQLYVQKRWTDRAAVRAGRLAVPIGMANLYDHPFDHFCAQLPAGEEAVLPAVSNGTGVSLTGSSPLWRYEVQTQFHADAVAFCLRGEWMPTHTLHVATSGYYDGELITSVEMNYLSAKGVVRGMTTYAPQRHALHVGAEAGRSFLCSRSQADPRLVPFIRYDLTCDAGVTHYATLGMSLRPMPHFIIKASATRMWTSATSVWEWAVGLGLTLE
ncbi:MAG: hypothetical protein HUK02_02030 [Bacteroidaceae bacterium]|nr:hypothetical protein [Bacteroidaceae bacterium]